MCGGGGGVVEGDDNTRKFTQMCIRHQTSKQCTRRTTPQSFELKWHFGASFMPVFFFISFLVIVSFSLTVTAKTAKLELFHFTADEYLPHGGSK